MKIKTKWNMGNFTLTHGADVPEQFVPELAAEGLLHRMQRTSSIDKILGIVREVDGKQVRDKTLKRIDVAYSDEVAQRLSDAMAALDFTENDKKVSVSLATAVEEYVRDTAQPQYKAARAELAELESRKDWPAIVERITAAGKAVGVSFADTHGDDGDFAPDFVRAYFARVAEIKKASI